jgi:hypothetical protein
MDGRARLPHSPMILTKLLICLDPASGYTSMLAEPRYNVWHGEGRYAGDPGDHFPKNVDASDARDPRLGARTGLARLRDRQTVVASLKFSGHAGASPYQWILFLAPTAPKKLTLAESLGDRYCSVPRDLDLYGAVR